MKRLLLIQFRTDTSAAQELRSFERVAEEAGFFGVHAVNCLDESVSWDDPRTILSDYDGLILGGSGEFHFTGHDTPEKTNNFAQALLNVTPLLEYVIAHDFPTLGVCFGHQMIAHFLGTETIEDEQQAKAGSHAIERTQSAFHDSIFCDLPDSFYVQYGHKGSLKTLPANCTLLAKGENCNYGAFKNGKNIYGVQFHPEMNKADTIRKMQLYPEYKEHIKDFETYLKDTPHGEQVIVNFARHAKTHR